MSPRPISIALLGVPVLMTLHNAEEALFFPRMLPQVVARLPASLAGALPTAEQMHVALAVGTVVPWLVWLLGVRRRETRLGVRLLLLLQFLMLINVGWHAAAAVVLGGYTPGLATALAFNLPFSIYLLRRAMRERWWSASALSP
jgi:hypothetical protein